MEPLALAAGALALWLYHSKGHVGMWDRSRLERSGTAHRLGIDNSIPQSLYTRARGIGLVCAYLERGGFRISSVYRSTPLTDAIYREAGRSKPYSGPGAHGELRAFDLPLSPGVDDPAELLAVAALLETDPKIGELISKTLPEGDHLHVEMHAASLDALGASGKTTLGDPDMVAPEF